MIIDTHSHCYWDSLLPRIDTVIENMTHNRVELAVQIGCDIETSKQAIDLAQRFPTVFRATVGYHPEESQDDEDYSGIMTYESLILEHRDVIVAIGETGLDYHYLDPVRIEKQKENQKNWWCMQHELAMKYDLPLVIHTRDARGDTIEFIKTEGVTHAVMHCFSEDAEFAKELLEFSDEIYFSFSGILTYKSAQKIQEAAQYIPLSRILIETDAPFLSPQVVRGQVNEPGNTRYVLEKLIELRSETADEIEKTVYENSKRFYGI